MNKIAYNILRIGLGITFLWMGILIWQSPELFGSFLQSGIAERIPDLAQAMKGAAVLDIVVGVMLLTGLWTWLWALIGALHLVAVIVGIGGFGGITARDTGLLLACVSLVVLKWPSKKLKGDQSTGKGALQGVE